MKKFFILIAVLMPFYSFSQITLGAGDFPSAGDSYVVSIMNDLGSFDFAATGEGYVWDFSGLVPQLQDTVKFISASSTSLPITYIGAFNNFLTDPEHDADVANYQSFDIPVPMVSIEDYYAFYKIQTDAFIQVGVGIKINSAPLPVLYNPTDTIITFPVSYGNMDTCYSAFNTNIPTIGYFGEQRTRYNFVDGWGTVTTPYGTFSALRIQSYSEIHDSLHYEQVGMSMPIDRTETEYKWYAKNYSIPILNVVVREGMNSTATVTYIDSIRHLSLNEYKVSDLNIYPNPSTDHFYIDVNENFFPLDLNICDMTGRTIMRSEIHNNKIDVSQLPKGIYFLSVTGTRLHASTRIIIQ